MEDKFSIRPLEAKDADQVSRLHYKTFKNFFLSSLGTSFLKFFYKTIILDAKSVCVGLFEDSRLVAFAVGNTNNTSFYKQLIRQNLFFYSCWLARLCVVKPSAVVRIAGNLAHNDGDTFQDWPCLLSIASESGHAKGLGARVLAAFEEELVKKGLEAYFLTTDHENNERVNAFYHRNGLTLHSQKRKANGRSMNYYCKNIK